MIEQHPGRIPVICEPADDSLDPAQNGLTDPANAQKTQYMVPKDLNVAAMLENLYAEHMHPDKFLYLNSDYFDNTEFAVLGTSVIFPRPAACMVIRGHSKMGSVIAVCDDCLTFLHCLINPHLPSRSYDGLPPHNAVFYCAGINKNLLLVYTSRKCLFIDRAQ
eukprot:gene20722-12_t